MKDVTVVVAFAEHVPPKLEGPAVENRDPGSWPAVAEEAQVFMVTVSGEIDEAGQSRAALNSVVARDEPGGSGTTVIVEGAGHSGSELPGSTTSPDEVALNESLSVSNLVEPEFSGTAVGDSPQLLDAGVCAA